LEDYCMCEAFYGSRERCVNANQVMSVWSEDYKLENVFVLKGRLATTGGTD